MSSEKTLGSVTEETDHMPPSRRVRKSRHAPSIMSLPILMALLVN